MKSYRGASPIISAMLLIVIVVAGFSLLYASTQGWIYAQRREELMAMQERLIIEDIWFRTINNKRNLITIYVRNVGLVDVTIIACTINDAFYTISPSKLELIPEEGGYLNVTFSWIPNTTYKISLKTSKGSVITTYETS